MALTITIEGKGVIANSDALTNDTGGTGTGDWTETGLGSMSLSTETYLYGSSCVATAYSNKSGWSHFDIGAGNELDFTTTTGTEEGQLVYMWVFFPTPGLGETVANGGFQLRLGSSTTDYRAWIVSASDDLNGWYGDWKCFVIDPNTTGSVTDTGTFDIANVRYFGFFLDATATAKGDNLFIDQIAVGSGLRITGTSTTGWKDVVDYCTAYGSRAWGMAQERDGIYYLYGNMYIGGAVLGDGTAQNEITDFDDEGRIIRFATTQYRNSGGTWVTTIPAGWAGIYLEDTGSYATTFEDGVIVGTDAGRSGSTIIGDPELDVSFDCLSLSNAGSDVNCYGTSFKNLTGTIAMDGDTDHAFYSCNWSGCEEILPGASAVFRNCVIAETASSEAALRWMGSSGSDMQDCQFLANTNGAAIRVLKVLIVTTAGTTAANGTYYHTSGIGTSAVYTHEDGGYYIYYTDVGGVGLSWCIDDTNGNTNPASISYWNTTTDTSPPASGYTVGGGGSSPAPLFASSSYYDYDTSPTFTKLYFDGNTYDLFNNTDAAMTVTKAGTPQSDPSTYEGSTVTFQGSVTVTITVKDTDGTLVSTVQTAVYATSDRSEIMNEDTVTGVATETYTGTTPVEVEVRCRKASSGATKYKNYSSIQTISSSGLTLTVTLEEDPNNNATT